MRREDGWALVTALMLMLIIATFGAATLAAGNGAAARSADARARETSLTLAEAALNAQAFALVGRWPGRGGAQNAAVRAPASCDRGSTDPRCPEPDGMRALLTAIGTGDSTSWTTSVRDNLNPARPSCLDSPASESYWDDSLLTVAPSYDCNGDGRLWLRSSALASGHRRAIVALVRVEPHTEPLPHVTLLAGRLDISNMGRKTIIDTAGSSAGTGPLAVRCEPEPGEEQPCLGHPLGTADDSRERLDDLLDVQITPNVSETGYPQAHALPEEAIERLRATAVSDGTYWTTCPPTLTGAVVFVDVPGGCSYTGNSAFNSPTAPGVLIMASGPLSLGGTVRFDGVVYHLDEGDSDAPMVILGGNASVHGGVLVDGEGSVTAGSSRLNITFDEGAFDAVRSHGSAGLVQNTWRELSAR